MCRKEPVEALDEECPIRCIPNDHDDDDDDEIEG